MQVDHFDHVVLVVRDLDVTTDFYTRVLGMGSVTFGGGRRALAFGSSKIDLHQVGKEFEPKTHPPMPDSATAQCPSPARDPARGSGPVTSRAAPSRVPSRVGVTVRAQGRMTPPFADPRFMPSDLLVRAGSMTLRWILLGRTALLGR